MSDHGRSEMENLRSGQHQHESTVPIARDGEILYWMCWCGARCYLPKAPKKKEDPK